MVLHNLVPDAPLVQALRTLLTLQHARRRARVRAGELVFLGDQDRSLWAQDELAAGLEPVAGLAPTNGYAQELRLQGLIASEHDRAQTTVQTNWEAIADHYLRLEELTGSPIIRLNRAIAVAETDGARAGLEILRGLDDVLANSHRLYAVRAELARRAGDLNLARASYDKALDHCTNEVEIAFLGDQRATLGRPC